MFKNSSLEVVIMKKLLLIGILFLTASCDKNYSKGWDFLDKLNGFTDQEYGLLKSKTQQGDGWIVFRNRHLESYTNYDGYPDYRLVGFGPFFAINLNSPDRGNYANDLQFFNGESIQVNQIGSNSYQDINGNIFEIDASTSKDLEKIGNFTDKIKKEKFSEDLMEKYGFSVERSVELANLLSDYNRIINKRSLTEKDQDFFSKKVLGVDIKNAEAAIKEGSGDALNDLIQTAAKLNGVTPEQVQEILLKVID
jgi:hypothetical protein